MGSNVHSDPDAGVDPCVSGVVLSLLETFDFGVFISGDGEFFLLVGVFDIFFSAVFGFIDCFSFAIFATTFFFVDVLFGLAIVVCFVVRRLLSLRKIS